MNWKSILFVEAVVMYANIPSKASWSHAHACNRYVRPKRMTPCDTQKQQKYSNMQCEKLGQALIDLHPYICNHLHTSPKIWRKWHFLFTKYLAKEVITALQNQFSTQLVFQQFPPKEHSRSLCQKHWGGVGPYTIERDGVSCMMTNMMVLMWVYDSHTNANASAFWILLDSLGCMLQSGRQNTLSVHAKLRRRFYISQNKDIDHWLDFIHDTYTV